MKATNEELIETLNRKITHYLSQIAFSKSQLRKAKSDMKVLLKKIKLDEKSKAKTIRKKLT